MVDFFETEELLHKKEKKREWTQEQKELIEYSGDESLVISSVAGSGKTASCVARFDWLLKKNVPPQKIIFFSFTTDAVGELKDRINNDKINITTIHAFCYKILRENKKWKRVAATWEFMKWMKKRVKKEKGKEKNRLQRIITSLETGSERIMSDIATYKLNKEANVKSFCPECYMDYVQFLYEEKKYDFSDLIIQVYRLFKNNEKIRKKYQGTYDHIFVDEYQDTSVLQMQILLYLNARQYYLVGDRGQAIYSFSGNNYELVEGMLRKHRTTQTLNLTKNFRSVPCIVEHSNAHTPLQAIPHKTTGGQVREDFISWDEFLHLLQTHDEITALVRTNRTIRHMEEELLRLKIPLQYNNYITQSDIEKWRDGEDNWVIRNKFYNLVPSAFPTEEALVEFIQRNHHLGKTIQTIHKSKGREYETVVVVNSFSPELVERNQHHLNHLSDRDLSRVSFHPKWTGFKEEKCVHYVACTRPMTNLFFMYYDDAKDLEL